MSTLAEVYKIRTPLLNDKSKSLSGGIKSKACRVAKTISASLIYSISMRYTALNCIKVWFYTSAYTPAYSHSGFGCISPL